MGISDLSKLGFRRGGSKYGEPEQRQAQHKSTERCLLVDTTKAREHGRLLVLN